MTETYLNITCKLLTEDLLNCNGTNYIEHTVLNYHDKWFWIYLGIYVGLTLFAGTDHSTYSLYEL
jgi:hypothetical protein